jgi:uncharacterized protein YdeI (BOF family)
MIATGLFATTVHSANPYTQPDEAWISLSGSVESVSSDMFTLDYGDGSVFVEMDDGDRDADGYKLLPGDKVTVTGRIDDDLYETTSIEAGSVYLEKLGTTFYASPVDDESVVLTVTTPIVVADTTVIGTIRNVDDNRFTVDTGERELNVMTGGLSYNPLDDKGYQQLEQGDRVQVTGRIDEDFFTTPELFATRIIKVEDAGNRS